MLAALVLPGASANAGTETSEHWPRGVTVVKNSPLSPRLGPALVSTGKEIVVFGGTKPTVRLHPERLLNDGAILDVETGQWTRIARAPFDPPVVPAAVWTGHQLVVLGSACVREVFTENEADCGGRQPFGAVYSRETDSWRKVSVPRRYNETGCCAQPLIWTGTEAVFGTGNGYVAVNPGTGAFRDVPLPASTTVNAFGFTCIAGKHVVVAETLGRTPIAHLSILDRDARRWTEAKAPATEVVPFDARPVCTRGAVLLVSGDLSEIVRYDMRTGQWSTVTPPARQPVDCGDIAGCEYYFRSGHGQVADFWPYFESTNGFRYDTVRDRWLEIAVGPVGQTELGPIVWAASVGATYAEPSTGGPRRQLVIYRPD